MESYKYLGIVKEKGFNNIGQDIINFLVENEIIVKDNDVNPKLINFYSESDRLAFPLVHNSTLYELSDSFFDEIYSQLESYVENTSDVSFDLSPIFFELESYIDVEEKISFLKQSYKTIYPKDYQIYSMYIDKGENAISTWKDWVKENINNCTDFLKRYLTAEKDEPLTYIIFDDKVTNADLIGLIDDWQSCYKKSKQLPLILAKIKELEDSLKSKKSIDFANKTLEDILDNEMWGKIKKKLIIDEIINENLVVNKPRLKTSMTALGIMSYIGFLVKKAGLLKYQKDIANVLNNTFKTSDDKVLSESNFSNYIINFETNNGYAKEYSDLLSFINKYFLS